MANPTSRSGHIRGYDVMFVSTAHCLQSLCPLRGAAAFPSTISVLCLWVHFPTAWTPSCFQPTWRFFKLCIYTLNMLLTTKIPHWYSRFLFHIYIFFSLNNLMGKQARKEQRQNSKQIHLFSWVDIILSFITKNYFFTCEQKYKITVYIHHYATAITHRPQKYICLNYRF